jgi:hypothetical protein
MHLAESEEGYPSQPREPNVIRFDNGGWVPGLVNGGTDPDGSTDITGTVTARDLPNATDYEDEINDFLRDQQNVHRSAIKVIQDYLDRIPKGKVNATGSTENARHIDDNTRSNTPGPRPDRFSRR